MRAATWTIDVAGRMAAKISPCTRPMASHCVMSVTYIRVRTTSAKPAPTCSRARAMLSRQRRTCAAASPATNAPSGPVDVVPDTSATGPTRTARL